MIYGSVCSGIESASVAWAPLGWRAAFLSEIDPFCRALLEHRFPEAPLHGDFTTIDAGQYEPIELLVGGTPCQSFSVAGLRAGLADDRGNLALEFLRLADRLRPRWLVWENVPGVLSIDEGRAFGSIVGGMVELGYGLFWRILDAQHVRVDGLGRAVPQRRRRVFVVGHLGDWRPAAAVFLEPESLRGDPPPRREAGQGAAGTFTARTGGGCIGRDFDLDGGLIPAVSNALAARDAKMPRAEDNVGLVAVAHSVRAEGFDAFEDGTGRGSPLIPIAEISASFLGQETRNHGADIGAPGDPMFALGSSKQHAIAFNARQDPDAWDGRTGPLDSDGTTQAVALRTAHTGANGHGLAAGVSHAVEGAPQAVAHGWAVRRLTPRECERLQGFPDDWTLVPYRGKSAADGPRYRVLGNSMAVNCMRWIGLRIALVERILERQREAA